MKASTFLLVLSSVTFSAVAQILLKRAASLPTSIAGGGAGFLLRVMQSPITWLGLTSFVTSLALWMFVLSQLPVSKAYPFISLGIVITVVAGVIFFGETIAPFQILAILMIVVGVIILVIS